MNERVAEWTAFAERLQQIGRRIIENTNGQTGDIVLTVALALLARNLSNLKNTLSLLQNKQIVEARTIARCCLENGFWAICLAEEGETFTHKMGLHEIKHIRQRSELLINSGVLDAQDKERICAWLRANKPFANTKTALEPKTVAASGDQGRAYVFYSQLSGDAAHPNLAALSRYTVFDSADEIVGVALEPIVDEKEIEQTLEFVCLATLCVYAPVGQIVDDKTLDELESLKEQFISLSNTSASKAA